MMRYFTLVPFAALALAACNQQPSISVTNASPEEVAAKAKSAGIASEMRPGQWETKIDLLEMNMPGMEKVGAAIAAKIKAEMMKPRTISSCMTADDVKMHGGKVFGQGDTKCKYDSYKVAGGTIDATMTCPGPQGSMTMHMTGSFEPETFTVEQAMDMQSPTGAVHSKARVTGRRIGDCSGDGK